jgi:hypothetical protein
MNINDMQIFRPLVLGVWLEHCYMYTVQWTYNSVSDLNSVPLWYHLYLGGGVPIAAHTNSELPRTGTACFLGGLESHIGGTGNKSV